MKKTLLNSSAFALAAFAVASTVQAEADFGSRKAPTPKLEISGESSLNMYFYRGTQNENMGRGYAARVEDSRLNFDVNGKADGLGGMDYSFLISVTGDKNLKSGSHIKENRLKVKGMWGTLFGGNTRGVDDFMSVGGYQVMGATGGFDGNFTDFLNTSTYVRLSTDLAGTTKDATKVGYVTPRFGNIRDTGGIQFGISFTPDSKHEGEAKPKTAESTKSPVKAPFDSRSVAGAINYKKDFNNGWNLALSLQGITARTHPAVQSPTTASNQFVNANADGRPRNNTNAYGVGGTLSYGNWMFGAEWMDNGKSQELSGDAGRNRDAGQTFDVAGSYTYGPATFALGYYHSERKVGVKSTNVARAKAKGDVYSATVNYKLAPGLAVYGEANYYKLTTSQEAIVEAARINAATGLTAVSSTNNNRGSVLLAGTKIKF